MSYTGAIDFMVALLNRVELTLPELQEAEIAKSLLLELRAGLVKQEQEMSEAYFGKDQ
jgi:hypothetical protein